MSRLDMNMQGDSMQPMNVVKAARGGKCGVGHVVETKHLLVRILSCPLRDGKLRRMVVPCRPWHTLPGNHVAIRLTVMRLVGLARGRSFTSSCDDSPHDCSNSVGLPMQCMGACFPCRLEWQTHIARDNSDMNERDNDAPNPLRGFVLKFICGAAVGTASAYAVMRAALVLEGVVLCVHVASVVRILVLQWHMAETDLTVKYIADDRIQWRKLRHDAMEALGMNESSNLFRACEKILALHEWLTANLYSMEFAAGVMLSDHWM
ncbi:hypothetical protein H310_07874 [Aphanomyces invadans]|uniref:Uncharacterized protein n=1 Tax=Aphanomyces invadans TaxID=157072 RepID=A0A024U2I9_9STRA|nr:hypothetical protein H310_07874 [Aphanomyces invadans]ETV99832.1 hypothetical protein H310_07874 [Aphanomyces invadans]|eukprot:XP_008871608.1 hypothetical protein H310_07874 [Aphanomyces invadans]